MNELVFYTNPMSRGRIVRWMLEEVGAPYRTELLDYGTTMKAPAYLSINPMGKVPGLTHGDVIVTEAGAICAYLADAFPQAGLAPPASAALRGDYYRWMFYAAGPVEGAITNTALKVVIPPERRAMPGYGSIEQVMDALEALCTGRQFLVGNSFSAVDVYLGALIGWGMMFGSIEKRPAFEAYVAGNSARPAAMRARAIDDALLAEQHASA